MLPATACQSTGCALKSTPGRCTWPSSGTGTPGRSGIGAERLAEVLSPVQESDAANSPRGRPSIGLRNVDGRLRALYGEEYRLLVESETGRGTSVQIRVPIEG